MKPSRKILFKGKHGIPEEAFLTGKSLLGNSSHVVDQKTETNKAIIRTMKTSKLEDRVDDPEIFGTMLADDFDAVVRENFDAEGFSDKLQESIMGHINCAFNNWFNANFRGKPSALILHGKDYKIHFYKHFKKEFAENFPLFLNIFLQKYNKEMAPYVAYENLILDALYDTYNQIDLEYNPKDGESEEKTEETDGIINIYLN